MSNIGLPTIKVDYFPGKIEQFGRITFVFGSGIWNLIFFINSSLLADRGQGTTSIKKVCLISISNSQSTNQIKVQFLYINPWVEQIITIEILNKDRKLPTWEAKDCQH